MASLSLLDQIAIAWFIFLAFAYSWFVEHGPWREKTLSFKMNTYREAWLRVAQKRELRIVDTSIVAGLQNGTAFFASASLLAIGGCFGLLRSASDIFSALKELPVEVAGDLHQLEMKIFGLMMLLAYAFFKFGWSFRLLNYSSILIGAIPQAHEAETKQSEHALQRALSMGINASTHFNRGLRTFFFCIGYIGWFIGPAYFIAAATWITMVLYRRQFHSKSLLALSLPESDATDGK